MQIIGADFVVICNSAFNVLKKGGICFDGTGIIEVDSYIHLCKKYPNASSIFYDSCAITPALANLHLHLEFSQNEGILEFGDFGEWLNSVVRKREELMDNNLDSYMQDGIMQCLKSGVGFVGAISSYGYDLKHFVSSPLRVLYFNEIIGSKEEALDVLYQNFLARLIESQNIAKTHPNITPAIAIHSPYSVHPKLLQKALTMAKEQNLFLSVHFLESLAEKEWLESNQGYFKDFYKIFFGRDMQSFYKSVEFLEYFKGFKNVYFTHCLEADATILESIKTSKGKIISCPKSNRLLNNKILDLNALFKRGIPLCLATDGKSSNDTLNLLDELRIALFAYADIPLESLAKALLLSVTRNPFVNTPFNLGSLEVGNLSDFAIFKLPKTQEFLAQNLILYAKEAYALYINGKEVLQKD